MNDMPHSWIPQPIVHSGDKAEDILNWMIENKVMYKQFKKPDNITFITAHNYIDDETGTAESKLHRHNKLQVSEDGRKITLFEKSLEYLGLGYPVVVSKPVCGHHITDEKLIEKYGMYAHLMKEEWILDYLKNNEKTELSMWCDAGDVIFKDNPQKIIDIFYEYNCDGLFMSTTFCQGNKGGFHGEWGAEVLNWQNSMKSGLYLNSGVVIGKTDFLIEILEKALEYKYDKRFTPHPPEAPPHLQLADDQEVFRYIHPKFHPRMKIDNEGSTEVGGRKLAWRH